MDMILAYHPLENLDLEVLTRLANRLARLTLIGTSPLRT